MDVNRVGGYAPPPPGTGEFVAPTPAVPAPAPPVQIDVQAHIASETRERYESSGTGTDALSRAVGAINTSISSHNRHLSVSFHEATGRRMVTVYDSETNEAIREIPPQRVLDAHASILELAGLFVDSRG
jgi:flagellar protein FlaG